MHESHTVMQGVASIFRRGRVHDLLPKDQGVEDGFGHVFLFLAHGHLIVNKLKYEDSRLKMPVLTQLISAN